METHLHNNKSQKTQWNKIILYYNVWVRKKNNFFVVDVLLLIWNIKANWQQVEFRHHQMKWFYLPEDHQHVVICTWMGPQWFSVSASRQFSFLFFTAWSCWEVCQGKHRGQKYSPNIHRSSKMHYSRYTTLFHGGDRCWWEHLNLVSSCQVHFLMIHIKNICRPGSGAQRCMTNGRFPVGGFRKAAIKCMPSPET